MKTVLFILFLLCFSALNFNILRAFEIMKGLYRRESRCPLRKLNNHYSQLICRGEYDEDLPIPKR